MKIQPMIWWIAFLATAAAISVSAQDPKADAAKDDKKPVEKPLFPDKQLEAAVRQQVFAKRNSEEPIFESDVTKISLVRGRGMGIKDLTGLEKCKTILSIDLAENEIADLSPIAGLDRVQQLILNDNQIVDLTPLAGMKKLQYIGIDRNKVKSLAPLKDLEKLRAFYASGNQVEDLSPLLGIERLHTIQVNDNQVKKIDGISGLKWLDSLGLRNNQISDLKPLIGMRNLMYHLFLEDNQISDLAPLIEMAKKDMEGEKRFAPFLRIYLKGNPLDSPAAKAQLAEMKKMKLRVEDL